MTLFPSPVDTYHSSTYAAIDSKRLDVLQKHKNVVVTGAGSGIGQAIATSFARAHVSNLALVGRRLEALQQTKDLIGTINPEIKPRFGVPIHTLIANAGVHPGCGNLVDSPIEIFSTALLSNAIGTLNTLRDFMPYIPTTKDASGYRAHIVHTSSGVTQVDMPSNNAYAVSKAAATKFVQAFAVENPDVWVVNFHPGLINSPMSQDAGFHFDNADDVDLPGDWTVWATSKGSSFVPSGRFLWAHWDVDELETLFAKMKGGEIQDGEIAMGTLPIGQRFTLGLSGVPT